MGIAANIVAPKLLLRWMVSADLRPLYRMVDGVAEPAWTRTEFDEHFRSIDIIGKVAEINNKVVGFIFYRLDEPAQEVMIENLAVAPEWRRQGVGEALVRSVCPKLRQGYDSIVALVPERNLPLQLLLRRAGFAAVEVLRGWYSEEDAYRMVRSKTRLDAEDSVTSALWQRQSNAAVQH